jgi:hypothetical protein
MNLWAAAAPSCPFQIEPASIVRRYELLKVVYAKIKSCLMVALMSSLILACSDRGHKNDQPEGGTMRILFLHHSTGQRIWNAGLKKNLKALSAELGARCKIEEREFPKESPYGWNNYPFDYWNIWVDHAAEKEFKKEPTLATLTKKYDLIMWKHCFPVGAIEADTGSPLISSDRKSLENYRLQYEALKRKMHEYPETRFLVWTGAALTKAATNEPSALRMREFANWVKEQWDEPGDNVFIWDFYELETEGGLYLKDEYADSPTNSHPNKNFAEAVVPLLSRRLMDVLAGRGDETSLTGK